MAGFERYYGARNYSPNQIRQDQTSEFGPREDYIGFDIKTAGFRPTLLTGDNPIKPDSRFLLQRVEFAEAIPYVQLSHSLDSVR